MKKVEDSHTISVEELADRLESGDERLTVCYKAKSEQPYYTFLKSLYEIRETRPTFCFQTNLGIRGRRTYSSGSITETLKLAISGGKEVLVFSREEQDLLYNL